MKKITLFSIIFISFSFAYYDILYPNSYPGLDTLKWCNIEPYGGGYTGSGKYFGYGVKLTPNYYPAIINGVYHRVFRLYHPAMHIRIVDDDGSGGAPQTTLFFFDTLATSYTLSFVYHPVPPNCTIWDGSFYLFILNGYDTTYGLNWLRDSSLNAPSGIHWRHQQGVGYSLFSPASDMQMCAIVEYHDVSLDSIAGLPDTCYLDSIYPIDIWTKEWGGFFEREVPIVFKLNEIPVETTYLTLPPNSRIRTRIFWRVNLPTGNYLAKIYTVLRSDTRKINDTIRLNITITRAVGISEKEKKSNLKIYNILGKRINNSISLRKGIYFIKEEKKIRKKVIIK
ncbi:MAG: hypothetical protein ABIK77_03195 [candidate division WOR-3 bacterium]